MHLRGTPGGTACIVVALALVFASGSIRQVRAQTGALAPADVGQGFSKAMSNAANIADLQKRIDARDALIRDLLDRVRRLEQLEAERDRPRAAVIRTVSDTAGPDVAPVQTPSSDVPRGSYDVAQQGTPPSEGSGAAATAKRGPGQFEVSEEAAQHALERALVQTGASLLPAGTLEFVPSVTYQYNQTSRPDQIALNLNGTIFITDQVAKVTQVRPSALFRMGLPFDLQAEVGIPYDFTQDTNAIRVIGAGLSQQNTSAFGLGDPTLTLTHQLFYEHGAVPSVFVSGTWDSDFGQTKSGIRLGTGFNELSASVTAVKRQDPLVFTAGFTFQKTLDSRNIAPANQYTPTLSMLIAVSPETSLRFTQQVTFAGSTDVNGTSVPGSSQTAGVFTFGLLSILARGLVMDLSASIGETPDASDFGFRLGFPIRLN